MMEGEKIIFRSFLKKKKNWNKFLFISGIKRRAGGSTFSPLFPFQPSQRSQVTPSICTALARHANKANAARSQL